MQLRPYQEEALSATMDYWQQGGVHPLVVMATGTGKSLTEAMLAVRLIADYPDLRVFSVTHVQELIEQNYLELCNIAPFASAGMYSAGLGVRDMNRQIVFGGIASLYRRVAEIGHVDLLIIDEAHLIPRDADTMYGVFITELMKINPDMRVVGFTATPYRTDSGRLDEGDERLFDKIVYEYDIADGIRDGYLCRLVSKGLKTRFDLTDVHRRGGDFIASELQAACDKDEITRAAVAEIVEWGQDRRSWLAFCAGVEHAYHVAEEIRRHGVTCETITGDTPKGERRRLLEAYKAGDIQCITNNTILTIGFNSPRVDLIADLAPTLSTGRFVQKAGRGTRNDYAPGASLDTMEERFAAIASGPKQNCLYLDFARNVQRHGPVDDVQPKKPGKGEGDAPVKECLTCHSLVPISCRECPDCGNPFPITDKPKHDATADVTPILKIDAKRPMGLEVRARNFHHHENPAGEESVRVEFVCGHQVYKMWLSLTKSPGRAVKFWKQHGGQMPVPGGVDEWLARKNELRPTREITVRKNGKYWEILQVRAVNENEERLAA
jgi:DNA repair protein RadD